MPLYALRCNGCGYVMDDVLCPYTEAINKTCTKCGQHAMKVIPPKSVSVQWRTDTGTTSKGRETK